ncbi:MAG: hypothetical protein FJ109_00750 [Deltaproteobacteria bacterium]|nr:hypothetical protein [Deltaproteobacteria bacterium]
MRWKSAALLAQVLILLSQAMALAEEPKAVPPDEESAQQRCARLCADMPCELMEFEGFSKDSTRFGHSYLVCPGPHGEGDSRLTWHVRELSKGKRKLHFKGITDIGQKMPGYFRNEGYEMLPVSALPDGKNRYRFIFPRGVTAEVEMVTETKVAWYLTVKGPVPERERPADAQAGPEGGHAVLEREIFRYRGEFSEIYFSIVPRVYLSPDGQKIAVLLALDAMVRVDAGLAVFSLNP